MRLQIVDCRLQIDWRLQIDMNLQFNLQSAICNLQCQEQQ